MGVDPHAAGEWKPSDSMIRIGDFARMSGVSVAALRHYDSLGLLRPVFVSEESGYRFYDASQFMTLYRIDVLKSLGFSLKEIQTILQHELTPKRMSDLLVEKKKTAEASLQAERQKIKRLELQIQIIEGLQKMTTDEVKTQVVGAATFASVPLLLPTNEQAGEMIGEAFDQLFRTLNALKIEPTGPCLAIWHSSPDDVVDESLDVAVPINPDVTLPEGTLVRLELPEQLVASVTHRGPFSEFQVCHIILKEWMALNGFILTGPYREIYHSPPGDDAVTEVHYPIKKLER